MSPTSERLRLAPASELHELAPQLASLEDAFLEQTHSSIQFSGASPEGATDASGLNH